MQELENTLLTERLYYTSEYPLKLSSGVEIPSVTLAYETYGTLNEDKSNAILLLHALSGDAHCAGTDKETGKIGWWTELVGPDKTFDTNRYYIICSNIIGSCYGSTGPASINPKTKMPYGREFPVVTVKDMVNAQASLIEDLGIEKLFCVAGGSLGGMQALEWALTYPDRVESAVVIAATAKMSSQNIAFNEIGRFAILSDPYFQDGNYYDKPQKPDNGLSLARMIGHITYLSEDSMNRKFGRDLTTGQYMFDLKHIEFQIQSYLHYQGVKFVERFDANSYLYITKAMDYFDVTSELKELKTKTKFLVIAFTSDWLFPISQSMDIVDILQRNRNHVSFTRIESREGHDSFLLNFNVQGSVISNFLKGIRNA